MLKRLLNRFTASCVIPLSVLCLAAPARAQVSSYTFSQNTGTYTPITGTLINATSTTEIGGSPESAPMDDAVFLNNPLPFPFTFNGVSYTTYNISTNGWIGFGGTTTSTSSPISNLAGTTGGVVAAFATDLVGIVNTTGIVTAGTNTITNVANTADARIGAPIKAGTNFPAGTIITGVSGNTITVSNNATTGSASAVTVTIGSGEIRTDVLGTAPNRQFVIQYSGFGEYSSSTLSSVNFQIILNEGGGNASSQTVTVRYGTIFRNTGSDNVQVGLRGTTTSDYNNRSSTTSWTSTTAGTSNTATVLWNATVAPPSGLEFTWTPPAPCSGTPSPGNTLSTTATACSGASFTLTVSTPPTGTGLSYQWESSPAGAGTFTPISGATNASYTTTQTAATDYQLTVTCVNGGGAGTSTPITINQGVFYNCYCKTNLGGANYAWIDSVAIDGTTLQNGPTGQAPGFYAAYPASGNTTADLAQGVSYTIYTRFGTSTSTSASAIASVWIDYNQNGTFESTEWTQITTNAVTATATISIPATALTGLTGMRIRSRGSGNTNGASDACSNFGSGETEDYIVNIIPTPTCLPPTAPAATNLTATSADLGWTSSAGQWELEYGVGNFTIGTGTRVAPGTNPYTVTGLTPNTTYSFVVRNICSPGDTSAWSSRASFTTQPTCLTPTGVTVSNTMGSTADVSWTQSGAAGSWQIEYGTGALGTGTRVVTTSNPYTITGLSGATTYNVFVRAICTAGDTSSWTAATVFNTPLPNNLPAGALQLTVNGGCSGTPYANTLATHTAGEPYPSCEGTTGYASAWFKFTAPASGAVRVSNDFGGTLGDSRIAVFAATDSADFSTFSILACDDDNGVTSGSRSIVYVAELTPGATYYVVVDGYSASSTKGTFCVGVDEITSAMLPPTGSCTSGQSVGGLNTSYTGWISLTDNSGRLIANVRQTAGTATAYGSSVTVNTGGLRVVNGDPYLDRNYLINATTGSATSAEVQFFFTSAELTALGAPLSSINVTRQSGTTCVANFNAASGTNTLLPQTDNGAVNDVRWVTAVTPGFSNFYLAATTYPLVIELGEIRATNVGSRNRVDWNTLTEQAGDQMEVERSTNGTDFVSVGSIPARGAAGSYSFWDNDPERGVNYYRLKLKDVSGSFAYSAIVSATVGGAEGFTLNVFPNPLKGNTVTIDVAGGIQGNARITVSDLSGRVIRTITPDSSVTMLDMSGVAPGVYLIRYSDEGRSQTVKLRKD